MPETSQAAGLEALQAVLADGETDIAARIMFAALELFARKGYAATSVREIVKKANVTNPMLYYYFQSKEGLFVRLVQHLIARYLDAVRAAAGADGGVREQIGLVVRANLDGVRDFPEVNDFVYSVIFGPTEGRPDIDIFGVHESIIAEIIPIVRAATARGELLPRGRVGETEVAEHIHGTCTYSTMSAIKRVVTSTGAERLKRIEEATNDEAVERLVDLILFGVGGIAVEQT